MTANKIKQIIIEYELELRRLPMDDEQTVAMNKLAERLQE